MSVSMRWESALSKPTEVCVGPASVKLTPDGSVHINAPSGLSIMFSENGETKLRASDGSTIVLGPPDAKQMMDIARRVNRKLIEHTLGTPPRVALDGFGRKRGQAWDEWTRALAATLERCNAKATPEPITAAMLLECEEACR